MICQTPPSNTVLTSIGSGISLQPLNTAAISRNRLLERMDPLDMPHSYLEGNTVFLTPGTVPGRL